MRFTFTRADLLTDISDKELTPLTTKLIADGEPSDKVERTIDEQAARVERYIALYSLTADHWRSLVRPLVLWEIYKRLATPPDKRKDAGDAALRELRDIRDGKFDSTLPLLAEPEAGLGGAGKGAYGSKPKLKTR
jgi:hypothetical protein